MEAPETGSAKYHEGPIHRIGGGFGIVAPRPSDGPCRKSSLWLNVSEGKACLYRAPCLRLSTSVLFGIPS